MNKIEVLINKNYITKEWGAVLYKPLTYFIENIVPELNKLDPNLVYPGGTKTFRAFNECPPDQVKVVILGQD